MKRTALALALVFTASMALAALKYTGSGPTSAFDPSTFPPEMAEKYKLMEAKCTNPTCHNLERTVQAIRDGVAPISKIPFDKEAAKAYGVKMMRRPDSSIDKKDAKAIVELLYWMIDQRGK